jgi:hypothetical protein
MVLQKQKKKPAKEQWERGRRKESKGKEMKNETKISILFFAFYFTLARSIGVLDMHSPGEAGIKTRAE